MSNEDMERRIKRAKAKRETLLSERAEKMARKKAAEEKLKKLEDRASAKGFKLEDLEDLLAQKQAELEDIVSQFESSLSAVEADLSKYED